ncbi:hypothetical protein RN001_000435 [Aquatica leii]|uniref:Non-lysosomal glucosylceramidase n=1 Tax=Aquatica leii TaxID=1421715 RepID=A0AAN7Q2Z1_9COLE|nr:hypothetical protein RN001_000435 [Aquatica leii]
MNIDDSVRAIPNYGLKLKLNHQYPENWSQCYLPRWKQVFIILPLIFRYLIDYIKSWWLRKSIVMDYVKVVTGQQIYGVPIGGIGGGSIGRGFRGEFCRYQLIPGEYEYNTVEANQFIVTIKDTSNNTLFQSLLSTFKRKHNYLKSWEQLLDANKCNYTGLYPRSWTEYDLSDYGIKLSCRQVSPIIPHNYKDSSLPCAMFIWSVENVCKEERRVTITFTFKNGTGDKRDKNSPCSTKSFSYLDSSGVVLYNTINKMPCAFAIAAKVRNNANISKCLLFDPNSDGSIPWNQLYENGCFDKFSKNETDQRFNEVACGIAVQVQVNPNDTEETEMCLVWDMPIVSFPKGYKRYNRFYTKYFGSENATLKIVDYAFKNYKDWESAIYKWQQPILDDEQLPDWYKSALFNETYFVSDGGTVWFALDDVECEKLSITDPRQKYGRFAYLEGHEYKMYNTYDVHFYASFALIMNWPNLQLILQYDMKDFIQTEIPDHVKMWYDGALIQRKIANTVPHDIGDPGENPFVKINSYPVHDVSEWRDLNVKFVLQVLRDFNLTSHVKETSDRKQYLEDMYEVCCKVMERTLIFDKDHDGLIENSGYPDQTYDIWVMTGTSAYCGGLWLAALYSMVVISRELNKYHNEQKYAALLEKGKQSFESKLWNGRYYNFDCSNFSNTIMADQICGHWYLRSCGFDYEVFPKSNVTRTLKTIFDNNVMSYNNGSMGAINGYIFTKGDDISCIQSEEVWTGVTYALAACMLEENLIDEAWVTAGGMFKTLAERIGMAFQTPEALGRHKHYRSVAYMRPLSIWAMQLAWQKLKKTGFDAGEGETVFEN